MANTGDEVIYLYSLLLQSVGEIHVTLFASTYTNATTIQL